MMTIVRPCLGCEQSDDHPKHVRALRDGSEVAFHLDCHAIQGCRSCIQQTRNQGDARGDDFRAILTTQGGE